MKLGWAVGLALMCVLALGASSALGATEADWLYEGAALLARFEQIGAADLPPLDQQGEYMKLLQDVKGFSEAEGVVERERRGREAVALLLRARIQEQLANADAAGRNRKAYQQAREAMPREERTLVVQLFQHTEGKHVLHVPRLCQVEARGNKVRVRALGYPLVGLLEKMSEATGVKIEFSPLSEGLRDRLEKAMGEKIRVEPEPSGLVDYVHTDWRPIDNSVSLMLGPLGLSGPGKTEKGLRISIRDPLYMASLAERAAKLPSAPKRTHPERGIERGYVIFGGRYVPPPYKVQFRATEERGALYVNGLQFPLTYGLKYKPISGLSAPPEADSREQIGDLGTYVGRLFANTREAQGREQAKKAVTDLLRQYPYVKSFEFGGGGGDSLVDITFTDGMEYSIEVDTYKPTRKLSAEEDRQNAQQYRQRGIERAQKLKRRLETSLRADGLVVICSTPALVYMYSAEDQAHKRLRALCVALQETARHKEEVRRALFELPTPESSDCAWEIFLNLRHRELWQRLRKENID